MWYFEPEMKPCLQIARKVLFFAPCRVVDAKDHGVGRGCSVSEAAKLKPKSLTISHANREESET